MHAPRGSRARGSTALRSIVTGPTIGRSLSERRVSASLAAMSTRARSLIGSSRSASRKATRRRVARVSFWTGSGTNGSGPAVERVADDLGRDVDGAVPEAVVRSGGPVVRLVGMQDRQLAGQADAPRAAVAERLHPGGGEADRIGVVPVRLERAGGQVHLGALEADRARSEPNRVAPPAAGPLEAIDIDAAQLTRVRHCRARRPAAGALGRGPARRRAGSRSGTSGST